MEFISIGITCVALVVTVVFGYLQIVVPFIRKEVRWSRRFPYVESTAAPRRRRGRRKPRRWVIPVSALAVVIVAAILFRVLLLQAAELPRKPIAVMTFQNLTGDAEYDYLCKAIPNLLITNLEQSDRLQVMTWERMHDLLKQLDKADLAMIDEETGFELCRIDDVNTIVTGSFTRTGDVFVIDLRVLEVSSKKLLKTARSQGEGVASILKVQVDALSRDIARNVSLFERTVAPTPMQIMEVTTSSMEAYNYFLRGRDDYEKHYYEDAIRFLERALEIDTTFASAYYYLGMSKWYLRDHKACNAALERARILSSRTTEKERLFIEAEYAASVQGDREKYYRIIQEMAEKYPREKRTYMELEIMYRDKGLYHKAIDACNKALELDPNYAYAWNKLGYDFRHIGNYARAIECLKQYAMLSPGDANPFDSMGDIYFAAGQLDEALDQYKEALFVKPDFGPSTGKIVYLYALQEDYVEVMKRLDHGITVAPSALVRANVYCQKAFYHFLFGGYDQTLNAIEKAETLLDLIEYPKRPEVYINWIKSWIFYDRAEYELSSDYVNNSFALLGKNPVFAICCYFYYGLIDLNQSNLDSANARLASIKSLLPEIEIKAYVQLLHDLLLAEILLARDSLDRVIELGDKTSEFKLEGAPDLEWNPEILYLNDDVVARAYLKKGDIDKAIAEYERLTDPDPNKRGRCLIRPTWHYELAKLYEEKQLTAEAIEQYEKFLGIWKDADEDRPEKIDARERLDRLKNKRR